MPQVTVRRFLSALLLLLAAAAADSAFAQPQITGSASTLAFGGQSMGTRSPAQTLILTNSGNATLNVSAIATSNTQFLVSGTCASVAAGASCPLQVVFHPSPAAGPLNAALPVAGTLTITSNAAGSPHTVPLTGTAEKSLVTQYFRAILGRDPDAAGKAFWSAEAQRVAGTLGANVNETWYAMAIQFFFSAEYLGRNRDNLGFLADLYLTFFNRAPDAAGQAFWLNQLQVGAPREVVLANFLFSAEFNAFTQSIFGNTAVRPEIDTVVDFYRGLLGRIPDDGGFTFWLQQFRAAQCSGAGAQVQAQANAISSQFLSGAEYLARNRSNGQFVADLYNAFLRRGADFAGASFWVTQLQSGAQTREQLRQSFAASPEFQARVQAVVTAGCFTAPPPTATPPGAPVLGAVTAASRQATVTFTAPASDGGAPILDYTATCLPGAISATGTGSPIVVRNLANGTAYTCSVTARNAVGNGPASASGAVTPAAQPQAIAFGPLPDRPLGTGAVTLLATGGASGNPVTFSSGTPAICTTGGQNGATLALLAQGTCSVTANQAGSLDFSAAPPVTRSFQVTPPPAQPTVPGAPTFGTIVGGSRQATFTFAAPSNGGSPIIDYTLACLPGPVAATGLASPIVLSNLVNGTTYSCTVSARNAVGNGPSSAAANVTPVATPQVINFAALPDRTLGTGPFTLSATGGASGNPVLFSSSTPGTCITGGATGATLTLLAAGTCTIAANQAGTPDFAAATPVTRSFQVIAAAVPDAPAIVSATPGSRQATVAFTAPANNGGLPILDYTVSCAPGPLTATGAGSPIVVASLVNGTTFNCSVTARNAMGSSAASAALTVTPVAATQTITFAALADRALNAGPLTLSATGGGSGNPVTFSSSTPAVCTTGGLNGATLTLVSAGTCTVTADQAGNADFAAAAPVARSFQVLPPTPPGAPTIGTATPGSRQVLIAFTAPSSTGGSPILDYTATCLPGPFSATGAASPIAVNNLVNGTTYTCSVTARTANGTGPASATVTVTPVGTAQVITFAALPDRGLGTPPITLSATGGGSGNPVVFSSSTPAVCTTSGVNGATLTLVAVGTCTVAANQAGNADFAAAATLSRSFQVTPPTVPGAPTIVSATPASRQATIAFTPPASNGGSAIIDYTATCLPGSFAGTATGSPVVVGSLVNGTTYSCTVKARNAIGSSAPSAAVNVSPLGTAQTITFAALADRPLTSPPFTVSATGGASGNPVTFSSNTPTVCSTAGVNGQDVTLLALGTCSIAADQAGSADFQPAAQVVRSFQVTGTSPPGATNPLRVSIGGFGHVASSSGGISCGSVPTALLAHSVQCVHLKATGTVTLTATPFSAAFQFAGWAGDTTCTTNPICAVDMSVARWVRAKFVPVQANGNVCQALGLVSDKANHPLNGNFPALAQGQSFTDPNFGTTIRKITNVTGDGRGANKTLVPAYSTVSAWNADESYLILYRTDGPGGGHELFNGQTYAFIRKLDDLPTADLEQFYWDTTKPNIVYGISAKTLYKYDVDAPAGSRLTVLRNFSTQCGTASPAGGTDPFFNSWDSKIFGIACGNSGPMFSYNAFTNTVGTLAPASSPRANPGDGPQAAPSGTKLFLNVPNAPFNRMRIFDLNMVGGAFLDQSSGEEHAGSSQNFNGDDTLNGVHFDPGPSGTAEGAIVQWNMNGTPNAQNRIVGRVIVGPSTGWPYPPGGHHISGTSFNRTGLLASSIIGAGTGATTLDGELLFVDSDAATNPGNFVCRVGHHRSTSDAYFAEPHAVISPSGTRILFGSSWGDSAAIPVTNSYVVELPGFKP